MKSKITALASLAFIFGCAATVEKSPDHKREDKNPKIEIIIKELISTNYSESNIINEELYPKIEKGFLYTVGTSFFYFIKGRAYKEAKYDAMIKILKMTGQKNIINKIHPLKREFYYEVYNLTNKDTLKA